MSVSDLMSKDVRTVRPQDTLATAVQQLWDGDCGALPVVDDQGVPISMISDRDICMAVWSRGALPTEIHVSDIMSSRVVAVCRADDSLEVAQSAMRMAAVRRLPVVDEQRRLVGIISLSDMARAHDRADHQHRARVASGIASTLAGICQKVRAAASSNNGHAGTRRDRAFRN